MVVALRRFSWDKTESVVMRQPTYQISRQISSSQTTRNRAMPLVPAYDPFAKEVLEPEHAHE